MALSGVSVLAVGAAGAGALLMWSGATGAGLLSNVRALASGHKPSGADTNPIPGVSGATSSPATPGGGGNGTASGMVAVAQSQLGTGENPPGSNKTIYGEWYGLNGLAWCDIFVSWCAWKNNSLDAVHKSSLTTTHALWFYQQGRWHNGSAGAQPGDILFLGSPGNMASIYHDAIATSAADPAGNVASIAGNTGGNDVAAEHWTAGQVAGYGRPAYPGGAG